MDDEQCGIHRERIVVLHAHRARIAHQITAGRIRRPGAHPPLTNVREQIEQCRDPRLVGVVNDKLANPRLKQSDGDRAARAPAPTRRIRAPSGRAPWTFCAFTKASPSSMSPCQVPQNCGG
jgi:hypothetical protein